MALTDEQVRREYERAREHWRRAEESARTLEVAARYRGLRQMAESGIEAQARRLNAEAGLLPCPTCGEWSDLRSGACLLCGEAVDWEAVRWKTGTWQVDLAFLLLFSAATGALSWYILSPEEWFALKVAAGLLLVPAGWLTYLNTLRLLRLLAWKMRRRGR